jgi:archaellum component FlaF (FlaF/FlaG flagellin family)
MNDNEIVAKTVYQNIANPQTIYVRLTNNNNGSYALSNFEIETDGLLGINSNVFSDLSIFPSPASERISIQSQFLTSESSVIIYNLQGQKVFSEIITPLNGKIILTISEMNSGIYLLKLTSEGNTITRKLVKN